jgi:hypothetical protein
MGVMPKRCVNAQKKPPPVLFTSGGFRNPGRRDADLQRSSREVIRAIAESQDGDGGMRRAGLPLPPAGHLLPVGHQAGFIGGVLFDELPRALNRKDLPPVIAQFLEFGLD